ncbi:MAG: metal ABC transporter ATP-binding protein [Saprospiraceae bacterium]|nr:metal ABC transporter ATP-binding protein [Saprospiraceae bacterium]
MTPVIDIKGLSVSYDKKQVLSNIYMELEPGFVYGILGPNGAGKSTLFKAILGLLEPTAGELSVFGGDIEDHRVKVAYIPQRDEVDYDFPATVRDIVAMGRYPHKGIFDQFNSLDRQMIDQALDDMGIKNLENRQIGQLSGGQQQRVFLARALAQQADLFFLDEPFVGVDMTTEEKIIDILKKLAQENKTLLVVHHDLSSVESYFDRIILLNQRLIAYGPVESTFTKENLSKAYGSQLTILHKAGML